MKLIDVIGQLRAILPKYTDVFSAKLGISSIVASGGTATITTSAPHNLITGDAVTLSGVLTQTPIASFVQNGNLYEFTTGTDHDLTENWHEKVELDGFTNSLWNAEFNLISANNRRVFQVLSTAGTPVLNSSEVLLEERIDGVNGLFRVTVTSPTEFTISGSFLDGSYVGGDVDALVRIAGAVHFERALEEYTEKSVSDVWMFVAMHDTAASKDRNTMSDAISTPANGTDLRIRIIDGFSLYILVNVSNDIAAQSAVDLCRHTLLLPILKSLFGARFDTGLTENSDYKTIFTGHGTAYYNRAVYAHVYNFQVSLDITSNDSVEPALTRAFRDINYTQNSTIGNDELTAVIDLDDNPILP